MPHGAILVIFNEMLKIPDHWAVIGESFFRKQPPE